MSPDTFWRKRRSCMTEADCARPPRWGSSPLGLRIWSTCVLGVFRRFLDNLRPLEKGACNDIIPNAVESDALFTCRREYSAAGQQHREPGRRLQKPAVRFSVNSAHHFLEDGRKCVAFGVALSAR
jgi:hypothetical protein